MNAIFQRRSIRQYTKQDISEEMLRTILRAGMSAPSAGNQRPWQFIVVKDTETLTQISEVSPYAGMTKNAPLAIVVCGDLEQGRFQGFWVQDCSAATQNILLEVTENGLGAVWLGMYPIEERVESLQKLFNLPGHIIPFSVIPIGYPVKSPEAPDRYDESRIHYNVW